MKGLDDLLGAVRELAHTEQLAQAPELAPGMGQVREEDQLARARATTNVLDLPELAPSEADLPRTSEPAAGDLDQLDAEAIARRLHPIPIDEPLK